MLCRPNLAAYSKCRRHNTICPHIRLASSHAGMYMILLDFQENFLWCLADSWRRPCGRISYRDDDDRLLCLRQLEELMAALGIEVADPARAQSLFRSSQAKMLHSDGDIDIAMRLAVLPYPLLLMKQRGEDIQRRFVEPRPSVA